MRKTTWIISILMVLIFTLFVAYAIREDKKEQEAVRQKEQEQWEINQPLYAERSELLREKQIINDEIANKTQHTGVMNTLFSAPDERLLDFAIPEMKKRGYKGTILLSSSSMPDSEGNLTVNQVKQLCDEGWAICIRYEEIISITEMYRTILDIGLPEPQAVYFSAAMEIPEMEINSLDIHSVIQDGKMFTLDDMTSELLYISSIGTYHSAAGKYWDNAIQRRNCSYILMGYNNSDEDLNSIGLIEDLDYFDTEVNNRTIQSMTPDEAYHYYQSVYETYEQQQSLYGDRLEEIDMRLEELNGTIY